MRRALLLTLIAFMVALPGPCPAQETVPGPSPAAADSGGYSALEGEALDRALSEQGAALEVARQEQAELFALLSGVDRQVAALRLQAAAYSTELAADSASSRSLADLRDGQQTAVTTLDETIAELSERRLDAQRDLAAARQQVLLFGEPGTGGDARAEELSREMKEIAAIRQEMNEALQKRIAGLGSLRQAYQDLGLRILAQIREKKRSELFEKSQNRGSEIYDAFSQEISQLFTNAWQILAQRTWFRRPAGSRGLSAPAMAAIAIILFAALQVALRRLGRFLSQMEEDPSCTLRPWRCLLLRTIYSPLPLTATALFFLCAKSIPKLTFAFPLLPDLFQLSVVALFLRWSFLLAPVLEVPELAESKRVAHLFRVLAGAGALAACLSVVVTEILGAEAGLLNLLRYGVAIFLLLWSMAFSRAARPLLAHSRTAPYLRTLARLAPYLASGTALVAVTLDLSGYGLLSAYFLASIGKASVTAAFGAIVWAVLREERIEIDNAEPGERKPYRWALLRLARLLWVFLLAFLFLYSFDASLGVYEAIYRALSRTVTIGNINFSLMGALSFTLILLLTRVMTVLFPHFFSERVLATSGMETGLKASLTTLFTYLIWAVGILFALSALGISTTSLAVAMGGLSLGLGFGLQNIFNNFISGLILLFERPIQVGDNVEVNGTWGVVRKINVRSTLVQTFDNASLIIPNSEFISAQVTNWSFKDPRVRRNLSVGVAYGSDVELVRSILLEISDKNPRIMKAPKPEVLFMDFADSALLFRLRFWCHVDTFLSVESELRFTIDRAFREKGVAIPFPQRDIHIIPNKEKKDDEVPD